MVADSDRIEFRILIKDIDDYYYISNVKHYGSETVCSFPDAGFHLTEHKSGEVHIKAEKHKKSIKEIPIAITTGSAGEKCGNGFRHMTTEDLGVADSITEILIDISSLEEDFEKYTRSIEGCFIIDKAILENTNLIHIGIWRVPSRNKYSFEFNNKGIPKGLLYKVDQCEPQIWCFAKPAN